MIIDVDLIKSYIKNYPVEGILYNYKNSYDILCGITINDELLWEGHESGDWIIDEEATDTLTGRRHKECTRCGKLLESEIYASDAFYEKYFTFYLVYGDVYSIEVIDKTDVPAEIYLPSSYRGKPVARIEPEAFSGCKLITKITIPKSIVSIGDRAFQGCYRLESVEFAEGSQLTDIGVEAFDDCDRLTSIVIPDSVTSIGRSAFYSCGDLTTLVIGDNVETIGERAFAWCWNITKVVIPDSVTSIDSGAFAYCNQDLVIYCEAASQPEGWDSRWNDGNRRVIWDCYCPCGEVISSVVKTVDPTCTTQGYTLRFCESCGSYSVSGYSAALGHSYVKTVKKANCDETDGMGYTKYTCSRCGYYYKDSYTNRLSHKWNDEWLIKSEPSETSLGIKYQECKNCGAENTAFIFPMHECTESGKPSFSVKRNAPPTCQNGGYVEYACDYCGDTFRGTYKKLSHTYRGVATPPTCTAEGYTTYTCIWGDSYVSDYYKKFPHNYVVVVKKPTCAEPGSINYVCKDCGHSYREIYEAAFGHDWREITVDNTTGYSIRKCSHCGGVEIRSAYEGISGNINIPSTIDGGNVVGIGEYCFDGCVNITSITLPDSITYIDNGAFAHCSGLLNVNISENSQLISIGNEAFYECTDLATMYLPDSLESIGDGAFALSFISTIAIPDNVTRIGNECFYDSALRQITFGANSKLSTIGERAFVNCEYMTEITIPREVTYIGERAFDDCHNLTTVTFAENSRLQGIMDRAFRGCGLTSITLPEGCLHIFDGAFSQCTNLAEINLPSTLLSVGEESASSVFNNTAYYNNESNWSDGVLYIGKWLIAVKSTVTEVEVASNCSSIGAGAISGFTHAASIKIPLSVKNIQAIAFTESENLTIYCEAPIKPEGWKDNWCDDGVTVVWGYGNIYILTESGEFLTDEQGNLLIL